MNYKIIRIQANGFRFNGQTTIETGTDLEALETRLSELEENADPSLESYHLVDETNTDVHTGEQILQN